MIQVMGLSKEEISNGCRENLLDPILLKIRIEKFGWAKDKAFTEPTGIVDKDRIWLCEEIQRLIDNGKKKTV